MELKSGRQVAIVGPDKAGLIAPYRFLPVYTMCHVGFDELFRPTGGQQLFKIVKPSHNITRNIMTKEYNDIITLKELDDILTVANPRSKAIEMYRPLLEENGKVSLIKLAKNVMPFGVTSIYQCKDWHKDFMTTVQPVLISGKCHVDKTDYTKQDTLRIPTGMCEVRRGYPGDPKHFVYMTFAKSPGEDWRPKFVVTPQSSYINTGMIETEGYSLVYPIGIIDYIDEGADNTSVYMFRPASIGNSHKPEEPVWMIEGFVFNTLSEWQLKYRGFNFYKQSGDKFEDFLQIDPARQHIVRAMLKMDDGKKREHSPDGPRTSKRPRFREDSQTAVDLGQYPKMSMKDREDTGSSRGSSILTFTLSSDAPRSLSRELARKITQPFATQMGGDVIRRINAYVEREMGNNRKIQLPRLSVKDYATVSAKDTFLVIAMAFLDRLKITGTVAAVAKEQMNMDGLFKGCVAKLTCLVNYFVKGMNNNFLQRNITFYHKEATHVNGTQPIRRPIRIVPHGPGIEDVRGAIFADFANKRFGGGVFGRGAIQEEIMLITHPESLLGRALFDTMTPESACVVMGAVRVSEYTGYGRGMFSSPAFSYAGSTPYDANQPMDSENRALTEILAFDAASYNLSLKSQYSYEDISHEYKRAAAAFSPSRYTHSSVPIATGLWGSGEFAGDPVLKILLQIAAASATDRYIILVRTGDAVEKNVTDIVILAETMNLSVDDFITHVITAVKNQQYSLTDRVYNSTITANAILTHLQTLKANKLDQGDDETLPSPLNETPRDNEAPPSPLNEMPPPPRDTSLEKKKKKKKKEEESDTE